MDLDGISFDPSQSLDPQIWHDLRVDTDPAVDAADAQRRQVAHDFESVLLSQLFQVMRSSIPESDLEDNSSEQIKSMYWSFLAQAVADEGGIGLWKTIYGQMPKDGVTGGAESDGTNQNVLDERI